MTEEGKDQDGQSHLLRLEQVAGYLPDSKLEAILEEIAGFKIELPEDPTLPTVGLRHLGTLVSQCRSFLNRTQFYLQITRRFEKNLRTQVRLEELSLELRLANLLADDAIVRQGPSADDRKALAITQTKAEHENLAGLRVGFSNLEDTVKIIKLKYDDLNRTAADIRLQRQMVKDDSDSIMKGGEGYGPPVANKDKTVPDGMAPPVRPEPIDPKDLLDPEKRPDDMPEPRDAVHANQISEFFNRPSFAKQDRTEAAPESPAAPVPTPEDLQAPKTFSYEDLLAD